MLVERSYRHCHDVTRASAGNFYYGIRLLPRPRRDALCAVYALARRVDDIGDGSQPEERKLVQLEQERAALRAVGAGSPPPDDPVLVALASAAERFPLPLVAFGDLVDGVEMDVRGASYASFAELEVYCRRVAGSIGRLSLGVFGCADRAAAEPLADDLGVAFQLTNILRDVHEDLERGRIYLPEEDLERFDCRLDGEDGSEHVRRLVLFETDRAEAWFERGLGLLPLLDRSSAACVGAMAGIYRRLLRRIEREPETVLHRRLSLPGWEKGWVAARSLAGAAR